MVARWCQFPSGDLGAACEVCSYELPRDYVTPPRAPCGMMRSERPTEPEAVVCQHLGEATGKTVFVRGCGCSGGKKCAPIHACNLHGLCVEVGTAFANKGAGAGVKLCRDCFDGPYVVDRS